MAQTYRYGEVYPNKNDVFNLKLKNSDDDSIITGDDNIIAALTNEEGKLIPNRSYDVQGYCMHMWFKPSDEVSKALCSEPFL